MAPKVIDRRGFTMTEKNVIGAGHTVLAFRSGKTGELFTVQSEKYSGGSDSLDPLHMTFLLCDFLDKKTQES